MTATRTYGLAALGTALALAALTLPVAVRPPHPTGLDGPDRAWLRLMLDTRSATFGSVASALDLTWAGPVYGFVCLVAVAGLLVRRRYRAAAYVAVTIVAATRLSVLLKDEVARPRPSAGLQLFHASGTAFPSGHSVDAAALVTALAVTAAATRPARRWTAAIVTVAAVLVATAMWSRTYAGVHWLSDTVAGVLLGVAVALAFRWAAGLWARRYRDRRDRPEADVDAGGRPS